VGGVGGRWQRPDDHRGAHRKFGEKWPYEMAQTTTHAVANDRVAHSFGHDEAGARRGGARRLVDKEMNDQCSASGSTAASDRGGEVRATPQSLRRS
jgi:hypothetical protein